MHSIHSFEVGGAAAADQIYALASTMVIFTHPDSCHQKGARTAPLNPIP